MQWHQLKPEEIIWVRTQTSKFYIFQRITHKSVVCLLLSPSQVGIRVVCHERVVMVMMQ